MSSELVYELPGSGQTLTVKSMTVEQVDMLASNMGNSTIADVIAEKVIPSCLGIGLQDYKKFLQGDETATIIALRRATWGDLFIFPRRCPRCDNKAEYEVNLAELEIKRLDPDQPTEGLTYELGDDPDNPEYVLTWHLPRVHERMARDKEMAQYVETQKATQGYFLTFSMAMHIDDISRPTPDGEGASIIGQVQGYQRRKKIRDFVMKQGAMVAQEFMNDIEEFSCGIETEIEHTCRNPQCGEVFSAEMPADSGFFFLTRQSLKRRAKRRSRIKTPWKKAQKPIMPASSSTPDSSSDSSTPSSSKPLSPPRSP